MGETFPAYSLNHSIWSVRASGAANWEPTSLTFPGIPDRRQSPPPTIACARSYNLIRYGRRVYAVPHSLGSFDASDEQQRNHPSIVSAPTCLEATKRVGSDLSSAFVPILVEKGYLGYNIVSYRDRYYSLAQDIAPVKLSALTSSALADLERQSRLFVADSHRAARVEVARAHLVGAR